MIAKPGCAVERFEDGKLTGCSPRSEIAAQAE
jgi:hypothetical protein